MISYKCISKTWGLMSKIYTSLVSSSESGLILARSSAFSTFTPSSFNFPVILLGSLMVILWVILLLWLSEAVFGFFHACSWSLPSPFQC
jgi:hypothetical protein